MTFTRALVLMLLLTGLSISSDVGVAEDAVVLQDAYPGLATNVLQQARLTSLPEGVLLQSGDYEISLKEIQTELEKAPERLRPMLEKSQFFLLENMAGLGILRSLAREDATKNGVDSSDKTDEELIFTYLEKAVPPSEPTEAEIVAFYESYRMYFGDAKVEDVKEMILPTLREEKRRNAINDYIRSIGTRVPILVCAAWVKEQNALMRDNPVDKARAAGMPSVVDFGSVGCIACKQMEPVLDALRKKYENKAQVLFINVNEEPVLSARFGIKGIPTQIFYDRDGRETRRHTGVLSLEEMEAEIKAMVGVQ